MNMQRLSLIIATISTLYLSAPAQAVTIFDDTAEPTAGFQNSSGTLAAAGLAENPDLIYNPNNGALKIDADGANMLSFNIAECESMSSPPNPDANFADLDDNVGFGESTFVDNNIDQIGWISVLALANIGFVKDPKMHSWATSCPPASTWRDSRPS